MKESISDAVLTINNTNTINPIRLKVNNTTRLEVGNAGVYATGSLSATGTLSAGGTLYIPDDIQHGGDADTKIRFPSNDTISFETAGSERLRITSGGNVGIGTDNPGSQSSGANNLVVAEFGGEGGITIKNDTNSMGHIFFADTDATAQGRIDYGHNGDYMRFYTANDERLRITSGGQVRLGNNDITTSSVADDLIIGPNTPAGDHGITIISGTSGVEISTFLTQIQLVFK